jgi:hypothetical protein
MWSDYSKQGTKVVFVGIFLQWRGDIFDESAWNIDRKKVVN